MITGSRRGVGDRGRRRLAGAQMTWARAARTSQHKANGAHVSRPLIAQRHPAADLVREQTQDKMFCAGGDGGSVLRVGDRAVGAGAPGAATGPMPKATTAHEGLAGSCQATPVWAPATWHCQHMQSRAQAASLKNSKSFALARQLHHMQLHVRGDRPAEWHVVLLCGASLHGDVGAMGSKGHHVAHSLEVCVVRA